MFGSDKVTKSETRQSIIDNVNYTNNLLTPFHLNCPPPLFINSPLLATQWQSTWYGNVFYPYYRYWWYDQVTWKLGQQIISLKLSCGLWLSLPISVTVFLRAGGRKHQYFSSGVIGWCIRWLGSHLLGFIIIQKTIGTIQDHLIRNKFHGNQTEPIWTGLYQVGPSRKSLDYRGQMGDI